MSLNGFLMRLIWLCVVPLLLAASWLAYEGVRAARAERDTVATHRAQDLATAIDQHLQARIGALSMLAASPLAGDASRRADLYREAQAFREYFGAHVILADPEMNMLFNTRVPFGTVLPMVPQPKGRAAAPIALETGAPAVGDIVYGPIAREPLVAIAVPGQRDGKTNFLLLATFGTRQFQQRLDRVALPAGWSLALQDSAGATIARRAPPGLNAATDVDAAGRFVVKSTVAPWSVVIEIPRDIYRAPLLGTATALALLILVATLVGVLGGRQAGRRLAKSVAALAQTPAPGAPPAEIAEIAAVRGLLDAAAERRASADAALRASEEQLRFVADHAPVFIAHCDREGRYKFVNEAYARMFGLQSADLPGKPMREVLGEEAYAQASPRVEAVLAGQAVAFEAALPATPTGPRVVYAQYAPERDASGRVVGFVAAILDITERKRLEEERDRLFNFSLDMLCVAGFDGDFKQLNPAWSKALGWTLAELKSSPWLDFVHPDDREATLRASEALSRGQVMHGFENRYRCRDGSYRWLSWNAYPIVDTRTIFATVRDVTERKQAAEALREAYLRLENVVVTSPGVVCAYRLRTDGSACFPYGGERFAELCGIPPGHLAEDATAFYALVHPDDFGRLMETVAESARTMEPWHHEWRVRHPVRGERWIEGHSMPLREPDGSTLWHGVVSDITERKHTEEALAASRASLEALTRRLLEVQESERRLIARELHDEVGGALTAVKLNLQALRRAQTAEEGEAILVDGLALVDGAIQSVRALSLDLRPAVLDDLGLIPALKWYCERQAQRAGVAIELALDAIDLKAAPPLESASFRIVQEAVTNALRHAGARRVRVALRREDGHFAIEIADDGGGFDAAAARRRGLAGESSGLLGMEERAVLLGGRLVIDSTAGAGTRVRARFAVPEDGFA